MPATIDNLLISRSVRVGWSQQTGAWLVSLVVHLATAIGLVLWMPTPRNPRGEALTWQVLLATDREETDSDQPIAFVAEPSDDADSDAEANPVLAVDDRTWSAVEVTPELKLSVVAANVPVLSVESLLQKSREAGSAKPVRSRRLGDFRFGYARTKLFGLEGEGNKFVYIFDRSGSMGGSGRNALEVAKSELSASLETLGDIHQFQIIFYSDEPRSFALPGQQGRLLFANDRSKLAVAEYLRGVVADGSTRHEDALLTGLRLLPDVIFFLTDGDEPGMSPDELERIQRLNGGQTVIHTIEFGLGARRERGNFLEQLARDNDGEYTYVDFTRRRAR